MYKQKVRLHLVQGLQEVLTARLSHYRGGQAVPRDCSALRETALRGRQSTPLQLKLASQSGSDST